MKQKLQGLKKLKKIKNIFLDDMIKLWEKVKGNAQSFTMSMESFCYFIRSEGVSHLRNWHTLWKWEVEILKTLINRIVWAEENVSLCSYDAEMLASFQLRR